MEDVVLIQNLFKFFEPLRGFKDFFRLNFKKTKIEALKDVSFSLKKGEVLGVYGKNGSGKTTLLKIVSGILAPSKGKVLVLGLNLPDELGKIKGRVGFVYADARSFFWRLSGYENLRFFAALNNIFGKEREEKIQKLLDFFELKKHAKRRFMEYSTGMRQKLSIARALLPDPEVIIFDEVSGNIDEGFKERLFDRTNFIFSNKRTVILSSHDANEILRICTRVLVLKEGKVTYFGDSSVSSERLKGFAGI